MTIDEFARRVRELGGDRTTAAQVTVSTWCDGRRRVRCSAYVHDVPGAGSRDVLLVEHASPEDVLAELAVRLAPRTLDAAELGEIPASEEVQP